MNIEISSVLLLKTVLYIEVNVSLSFQTLPGLFVEYLKVFVLKSNMHLLVASTCTRHWDVTMPIKTL